MTAPTLTAPTIRLSPCATCRTGCDCEGGVPGVGCDHAGCWGQAATNTCTGIAYERARAIALGRNRAYLHLARRRGVAVYERVRASILADAGLHP